MQNWHRWLAALGCAFLVGFCQCALDPGNPVFGEYIRHGLVAMLPSVLALKMTLEKPQ